MNAFLAFVGLTKIILRNLPRPYLRMLHRASEKTENQYISSKGSLDHIPTTIYCNKLLNLLLLQRQALPNVLNLTVLHFQLLEPYYLFPYQYLDIFFLTGKDILMNICVPLLFSYLCYRKKFKVIVNIMFFDEITKF